MPPGARILLGLLNPNAGRTAASHFSTTVPPLGSVFLPDFLVTGCGLSPSQAGKACKALVHVKSPENPTAVLAFLRSIGLTPAHVKTVVLYHPRVLLASVDKTLRPKVDALISTGFSEADVADIIGNDPLVLQMQCNRLISNSEFLRAYIPEKSKLLQMLRRKPMVSLLNASLSRKLEPNTALLQRRGVPVHNIARLLLLAPWFFTWRTKFAEELIDRLESMGFTPDSRVFVYALCGLSYNSKEQLEEKISVMKRFGWSEDDFYTAFHKQPVFIKRSSMALRASMRFFVEEVGFKPGYIVQYPTMLHFSLEKRLIPRLRVLKLLISNGILGGAKVTANMFRITDEAFTMKFIVPHLKQVPTLQNYPHVCLEEAAS